MYQTTNAIFQITNLISLYPSGHASIMASSHHHPPPRQQHHTHPAQLKHLLATYTTSHPLRSPSPLPPSSRVNPKVTQRLPPTATNPLFWSIPTWITFVKFLAWKALHIVWSLLSHFLWGPARKSWGYRMTFVSLPRSVSHLLVSEMG